MNFSVTCAKCSTTISTDGQHTNAFEFMAWARDQGWFVPDVLTGQPILCPKDKPNAQP